MFLFTPDVVGAAYFHGRGRISSHKVFWNVPTATFPVENEIISSSIGVFEGDTFKNHLSRCSPIQVFLIIQWVDVQ